MHSLQCPCDDVSGSSECFGDIEAHGDDGDSDSSSEVDLGSEVLIVKLHLGDKTERDCRICHLGLEGISQELMSPTELGCSCKGDLGYAHKHCAETWFKIRGNMICEICGSTAVNVAGEQTNQSNSNSIAAAEASSTSSAPVILMEDQNLWHGRRMMNFLLACMVFAFIISWLFHLKILS